YRYYYDDPEDPKTSTWNYWTSVDPLREHTGGVEWTVKYPPPDGKPFEPTIGPHIFVAELRDINLEVTHSEFRIEVLPGPKGKERLVYLVDDDHAKFLDTPLGPSYDQATHAFWSDVLDGYNWESFNTRDGTAYTKEVPIRRVGDATTVIWQADFDDQAPDTYLLKVCANLGNYLNSYVKVGGNLIIIGRDPVYDTMYWPDAPNVLDAAVRSKYTNLDFTPRISAVDSSKIYNFMWEAFGIVKMQSPSPGVAFKTLAPCEAGWDSIRTDLIPSVPSYAGKMDYAFFITKVRDDIDVHKMYSVIQLDSHGLPVGTGHCSGKEDEMKLVAVYVPGDGQRGYAAYIAIPSWFFDHDQVKVMIRKLLDMFGEPRTP
ncbi:MAG TPA: hypothetical protein VMU02_05450, partial [bacterium]|nr:hypothetical protein [bacterium]